MRYPYFDFFPYKIGKKCSDSNQNLNIYRFENCWYLLKEAYKSTESFISVTRISPLEYCFLKNWGIVTEKWEKTQIEYLNAGILT